MSALAQPQLRLTPSEYLARERLADHKSEFFDGEIFAMAGANERHNLIAANIISELSSALKKTPCKVYSSDMRVKIPATGLVHLSIVVCGEPVFEDEAKDTLLNPVLIVEVLSQSTEGYDRGKKFEHYCRIQGLKEYLLVAQDRCKIEQFLKQEHGQWLLGEAGNLDETIKLSSVNCELAVSEVYDKVDFD